MDRYRETFESWNKAASLYQDKFMTPDLYNDTYDNFCKLLSKVNSKILEIGCGPGNITKYMLSKRPDFAIDAIDIAPNMIELARKNNPSANFKVMDSRQINELQTTYDAIVCGFCLPYLSEVESSKLITDCNNLLTENGLLYLSFVAGDKNKSGYQTGSTGDSMYFNYHTFAGLNNLLLSNGFEQLKIFNIDYKKSDGQQEVHSIILSKKKTIA